MGSMLILFNLRYWVLLLQLQGKFSIVMLAIVNANYGLMFHACTKKSLMEVFYKKRDFMRNSHVGFVAITMATPEGILCTLPFTFVGHEAFPLFLNFAEIFTR